MGSINIDLVARAPHFPVPGESLIGNSFETHPGGKGANQAVACARLGVETHMVGCLGMDVFGGALRQSLQANGVHIEGVLEKPQVSSGVAVITLNNTGENNIIIIPGANGLVGAANLSYLESLLPQCSTLLMQLEIPLEAVLGAARLAHQRGVRVILDPAPAHPLPNDLYPLLDLITPNQTEAQLLTNQPPDEPQRAADILLGRGVKQVIIKMGSAGAYYTDGHTRQFLPPFKVTPVDTVAAGDAFNGGLASALDLGLPLAVALRWAMGTGALSVTKSGAQESMPTHGELEAFLAAQP